MTASSTPCCASRPSSYWAALLHCLFALSLLLGVGLSARAQNSTEISQIRLEQSPEGLFLSATIRFDLPAPVEEALLKGVPMSFVAEAQVLRDRWYWYDKSIAQASRSVRLAYQPLTRRWRVNVNTGSRDASGNANLTQNFDNLTDALASVRRVSRWKIAEGADIETDSRHNVDFRFRLDTSQLPRPMQIGITGNSDWSISVQRNVRPER